MNHNLKCKMIANDNGKMHSINLQIKGRDEFPLSEHTLEELDLVTMCFPDENSFKAALVKTDKIESFDTEVFIGDIYKYNGEKIRMSNLIYKSNLSDYLVKIAQDRLDDKEIDVITANAIIATFINTLTYPSFYELCANTQGNNFNDEMKKWLINNDTAKIRSRALKSYRVLREMVSILDVYSRLYEKGLGRYDAKNKYSKEIEARSKYVGTVERIVKNENYGKQMHLNDYSSK